jgi:ABC-2 type transport system ATP-binding protein
VRENNRFYIQHDAADSPAEALVEKSVAGNWGIYELIPEHRSLEQVFMTLTGAAEVPPDSLLEKGENVTIEKGEGTLENGVNLKKMNGATVKVNSIVEGT